MKLLKGFLIAGLSLLTIGAAISQTKQENKDLRNTERVKKTPKERAEGRTARMTEKLSLTDDQAKKLHALQLDFAKEEQAEREARKVKRENRQAAIRSLLTEEQALKFDELKSERKGKLKGRKGKWKGKRKHHKKDGEFKDEKIKDGEDK